MTRLEPMLWLSDSRGVYIPRDFVGSFADWASVSGIAADTKEILQAGPDHEHYWEAWEESKMPTPRKLLRNALELAVTLAIMTLLVWPLFVY